MVDTRTPITIAPKNLCHKSSWSCCYWRPPARSLLKAPLWTFKRRPFLSSCNPRTVSKGTRQPSCDTTAPRGAAQEGGAAQWATHPKHGHGYPSDGTQHHTALSHTETNHFADSVYQFSALSNAALRSLQWGASEEIGRNRENAGLTGGDWAARGVLEIHWELITTLSHTPSPPRPPTHTHTPTHTPTHTHTLTHTSPCAPSAGTHPARTPTRGPRARPAEGTVPGGTWTVSGAAPSAVRCTAAPSGPPLLTATPPHRRPRWLPVPHRGAMPAELLREPRRGAARHQHPCFWERAASGRGHARLLWLAALPAAAADWLRWCRRRKVLEARRVSWRLLPPLRLGFVPFWPFPVLC